MRPELTSTLLPCSSHLRKTGTSYLLPGPLRGRSAVFMLQSVQASRKLRLGLPAPKLLTKVEAPNSGGARPELPRIFFFFFFFVGGPASREPARSGKGLF